MALLADTWPIIGAFALVGVITYGALQPYIRAEKKRRERMEKMDD
ncbi:hypothetical protein [Puniceibacterium sediminis]|uniref:Uncharacterized protein n=1 Tax=Puniceibacterium sediminis TaxID=1608407 RepID=A0A238XJ14_9RHOB|nr:hypothetical protein [Puniceibacterium sediminis]SNR58682.1 hypothetical protein SAMN06265370_111118 [Puniceibacterium sediminis]